ncbi:MAG TPA: FAD-binding oxidoreductase [Gaiellaceae bacterium]|nr:FAD-binding oxidoreductase [Gaiellaceae bacterium]
MTTTSSLGDTFGGEIIRPGDPGYDEARAVWNGMIDRRPSLVVRPAGPADVIAAVQFAREQGLELAVRGGGHSIPGLSTCDDGIVIDLSRMRGVEVDAERRTARAAGGALLGELDDAAQAVGLVCPVGVVSHTGVAGLTLGGGMGRLQRKLGLTIDSLRAVELVTADGRLVRASEDEHPELFWGLRGAGANFGIATSFEFRLHPLDGPVTHGTVVHPVERAGELAGLFRELVERSPDELWLSFGLGLALPAESFPPELAARPVALVSVLHCGAVEEAERDLAALRRFGPPTVDSIEAKPHLAAQRQNDDPMEWGHRFYMKSAYLPALPDELVHSCVEHVSRLPAGADGTFSVWAWGRAIAAVPEEATAFAGREAAFWLAAEILWEDPALDEACRSWAREAMVDVQPYAVPGRYVNDVAETGAEVARAIYGDAKYERLVALKRAWDPDNVFRLNQNVRP